MSLSEQELREIDAQARADVPRLNGDYERWLTGYKAGIVVERLRNRDLAGRSVDWPAVWAEFAAWRAEAEGIRWPMETYLSRKIEEIVARHTEPAGQGDLAGRLARALAAARSTAHLRSEINERLHGRPVRGSWIADADAALAEARSQGLLSTEGDR